MPIAKIETNEYTCRKCGYKWINRVNGKDAAVPKRCARCKKHNWDTEGVTPTEVGLRKRITGFKGLYEYAASYFGRRGEKKDVIEWSNDLTERFLTLDPRPTIEDLTRVVYPSGLVIEPLNSQNQFSWRGWVPTSDKPGFMRYDVEEYIELRRQEARKRQEIMQQIIEARSQI